MDMSGQYRYAELGNDSGLRVLTVESQVDGILQCELNEVLLADVPFYEAISYTWGVEEKDCYIRCNKKKLAITANCEAALKHSYRNLGARCIWIDAICIDQSNMDERSRHVEMMGEIYNLAKRVIIWLGLGVPESDLAIEFLSRFKEIYGKKYPQRDIMVKERMIEYEDIHRRRGSQSNQSILQTLFDRSWFERMWTIQEAVLSENAIVLCGAASISWNLLTYALDRIAKFQFRSTGTDQVEGRLSMKLSIHRALGDLFFGSRNDRVTYNLRKPSLSTILAHTQYHRAKDPKDKVYALYGIFRTLKVPLPIADYRKSVSQIFLETMSCMIAREGALSLLFNTSGMSSVQGLPSWVPDFSDSCIPAPISEPAFQASTRESEYDCFLSVPLRRLFLKGIIVDTIVSCSELCPCVVTDPSEMEYFRIPITRDLPKFYAGTGLDNVRYTPASQLADFNFLVARRAPEIIKGFREWILMFSHLPIEDYPGRDDSVSAFSRMLIQDGTLGINDRGPTRLRDGCIEWYRIMTEHPQSNRDNVQSPFMNPGDEYCRSVVEALSSHPQASVFQYHALMLARNKKMFITKDGYMGTASRAIKDGDKIVLFGGVCLPIVVRPLLADGNRESMTPKTSNVVDSSDVSMDGNSSTKSSAGWTVPLDEVAGEADKSSEDRLSTRMQSTMPLTLPEARLETIERARSQEKWKEYTCLGPAYVQGIMDGERWNREGGSDKLLEELVFV